MAGRKLFLADDSLTIQKVINLTFADEGIEVLTAGDGDAALHRIVDEMPDLVLADVNMPGLTGYELCEFLRSDARTQHIPVILLVGAFEQFDEAEAARVGATAHLTKPFQSIRQLVNQVTDLIAANRTTSEPASVEVYEPESQPSPVSEPVPDIEQPLQPDPAPPALSPIDPFGEPVGSGWEAFSEDRLSEVDHARDALPGAANGQRADGLGAEPVRAEPDDIDRLYRQSIGEEPLPSGDDLPDLGVDDEMIETSYAAAEPDGDLDLLESGTIDQDTKFEESQLIINDEPAAAQPVSTYETTDSDPAALPGLDDAPEPGGSDETVRLDPAMVDAQMAESNRRFEEAEQAPRHAGGPIGEDTIRFDTPSDEQEFGDLPPEDIDLLDIPTAIEVDLATPADVSLDGGKQVVTLSPEVIELIAQRVVEKLNEKR